MALHKQLTKGRKNSLTIAACIYMTCRIEGTPRKNYLHHTILTSKTNKSSQTSLYTFILSRSPHRFQRRTANGCVCLGSCLRPNIAVPLHQHPCRRPLHVHPSIRTQVRTCREDTWRGNDGATTGAENETGLDSFGSEAVWSLWGGPPHLGTSPQFLQVRPRRDQSGQSPRDDIKKEVND